MTYRDDNNALRARVSDLQSRLASAQHQLQTLGAPEKGEAKGFFSPSITTKRHTFSGPLSTSHYERVADIIRALPQAGPITQVGRVLTSSAVHLDVRLGPRADGRTCVTWTDRDAKVERALLVTSLLICVLLLSVGFLVPNDGQVVFMATSAVFLVMALLGSFPLKRSRRKLVAQHRVAFAAITALDSPDIRTTSEPPDEE